MMASSPARTTLDRVVQCLGATARHRDLGLRIDSARVAHLQFIRDRGPQIDHAFHGRVLIASLGDRLDERLRQARIDRVVGEPLPRLTASSSRARRDITVKMVVRRQVTCCRTTPVCPLSLKAAGERVHPETAFPQFTGGCDAALAGCADEQYRPSGAQLARIREQGGHGDVPRGRGLRGHFGGGADSMTRDCCAAAAASEGRVISRSVSSRANSRISVQLGAVHAVLTR